MRFPSSASLQEAYANERALVEEHAVIPIAHLPELYAVSSRVSFWHTRGLSESGIWHFDDLWLETELP